MNGRVARELRDMARKAQQAPGQRTLLYKALKWAYKRLPAPDRRAWLTARWKTLGVIS